MTLYPFLARYGLLTPPFALMEDEEDGMEVHAWRRKDEDDIEADTRGHHRSEAPVMRICFLFLFLLLINNKDGCHRIPHIYICYFIDELFYCLYSVGLTETK